MELGTLLGRSRTKVKISQMELALRLGVSQRHVSFVESGRARPSRTLLSAWLDETQACSSIKNAILLQAGFSAPEPVRATPPASGGRRSTLSSMIAAHDPCPAIVFDAEWRMVEANTGGAWLCSKLMPDFVARTKGGGRLMDMILVLTEDDGLLSKMTNAAEVGAGLLAQLRVEEWSRPTLRGRIDALEASLLRRFGPTPAPSPRDVADTHLTLNFETEFGALSFFTVQGVFGLPQDVTVSSLRAELWFPADAHSRHVMTHRGQAA